MEIRRADEGKDLEMIVGLWNQNYPTFAYSVTQTKMAEKKNLADSRCSRWLALDKDGLAACLKLLPYHQDEGAMGCDLSYCIRDDVPRACLNDLLRLSLKDAVAEGIHNVWLWEQAGMGGDAVWHLNGFRHRFSLPFLRLYLDRIDPPVFQHILAEQALSGLTFLLASEVEAQGREWVEAASLLATEIEFRVHSMQMDRDKVIEGYRDFFRSYNQEDKDLMILAWDGEELAGLASFRTDCSGPNRLAQQLCGTSLKRRGLGLDLAIHCTAIQWARRNGIEEIAVGGEFDPEAIENWMRLGFSLISMWRRYHLSLAKVQAA
jgi:GNAT superfamily N-acetyltransferase